jgi:pimeloyl-ACP methyl ester carboxylesterase
MRVTLFTALLLGCLSSAFAQSYEVDLPPKTGEKYKSAAFRLWVPEGIKTVRAILIRQHGCGRNGIDHSDDVQWRALARKHQAALLGSRLTYGGSCAEWCDPKNGSERALLEALTEFAKQSAHPELTEVPWAIWGHSGGAIWACHLANKFPKRVVCVWARSGAITEFEDTALKVPIVFNYGEREAVPKNQFEAIHTNTMKAFETYRPKGAVWALAVDPKSWHDCRNSRDLAVRFFDEMLAVRLPAKGVELIDVKEAGAWRGDAKTLEIAAIGDKPSEAKTTCWLPGEGYAKAWKEYCKTGEVADTTGPDTPTEFKAVTSDKGVSLTWLAEADWQSGTKGFVILRDGKKLATVGSPKNKSNPAGVFQQWDFGDEPIPKTPEMKYLDADGKAGAKYEVVQVNRFGLESKPVAATAGK